jgi:hypothetical protein
MEFPTGFDNHKLNGRGGIKESGTGSVFKHDTLDTL